MSTVSIALGANIQAAINANPAGTIFQLSGGTYSGEQFEPLSGDQFIGASNGSTVLNGNGLTSPMTYNNGATNVVFNNVTTTNYKTPAQQAPIETGSGWQIINVTSTGNGGAGLYVGGSNTLVQGGSFSNNGQIGIDGSYANGSKIIGITADGNNTANYDTGWDAGGIKITNTNGLVLSGNTVSSNTGQGIWADINSSNWTISDNTVANNTGNGIMYEISHGSTTINNNIVTDNNGAGIYISNSDGVNAYANTVTVNPSNVFNTLGAAMGGGIDVINNSGRGNDPSGVPYQSINDDVHNNVIVQNNQSGQNGIWAYQALPSNPNNVFNANTYYVPTATGTYWNFGNSTYSWTSLQQSGAAEASGTMKVGMPVASSNDTVVVAGSSAAITDASGDQWTITSGGQVATNGVADTATSNVTELAYVNGTIWRESSSNLWYGETAPNDSWSPSAGTATSPLPAASSTITLNMSEDAWNGDAQFTVSVDGTQQGGTMTASALHATGDAGIFSLTGNWSSGSHTVAISFINDAYGGSPSTDRNLYVNSIAFNGTTQNATTATLFSNGTDSFSIGGTTAAATAPADTLTLNLAEDAWNGNAQFTLSIDGKQISTPQDVSASHSAGAWQTFAFAGNFGAGSHTIGVSFTNDAYGGTPSTDRNLYVNGIDLNGQHYGSGVTTMYSNGTTTFSVTTTH